MAQEIASHARFVESIVDRLADLLHDPADPLLRDELGAFIHSQLATSYFGLSYADPDYPDFWPIFNQAFNCLAPNPDDVYLITPIRDDGVYRLSGHRGSVRVLDFQLGDSPLVNEGREPFGPTLANYDLDTASIGADGTFEIIICAQRQNGYPGDWWQIPAGGNYLLARMRAYDWHTEIDGRLAIERLDRPAVKPSGAKTIDSERIAAWVENWARFSINWARNYVARDLVNRVVVTDLSSKGGFSRQQYVEGLFDLAENEALIYETEVPACRYWNIQLTDMKWVTLDYLNRQTSFNGHTAQLDVDGKFRAVISASDPGVPNWLDSAGHGRGVIFGRWLECDQPPLASVIKVRTSEVRKHLPSDTTHVTSLQREAAIRLRRKGAQLRRRW